MKVTYVVTVPGAGPVAHLLTLAPLVARAGLNVEVLCANPGLVEQFASVGVGARVAPLMSKRDVRGARGLWPLLRDADIIHTHDRRAGLFARPLGRLRGKQSVHTFHGLPHEIAHLVGRPDAPLAPGVPARRAVWLLYGYLRIERLLTKLGAVVVPSRAVAEFLVEHGFERRRVRVISNGVDVRRLEPSPAHTPFVVGTAGILEHRKGIDILLAACAAAGIPLRVEIFGDGSLRTELQGQADSLGLDAIFHGEVADVRARLENLDLFVLASRDENLPIALLEAMAAARPVVATAVGGVSELVEDDVSGLLVEPDDVASLAAAIAGLATDTARREDLARAGAHRVAARFSDVAMARATIRLYEELMRNLS